MINRKAGINRILYAGFLGIITKLLAVMSLFSAASAYAAVESLCSTDLISFVQKAATLIEKEGEAVFPGFRKKDSEWFRGDRYIFVWGLDGIRYVYPPDISGEGKSMLDLKDVNGKPIGKWFVAKTSSPETAGWVHYQWPRPGEIFPAWKSTFLQRAVAPSGKAYLVGSGSYNMLLERAFIVDLVNTTARMLSEQGAAGYEKLKDKTSEFMFMDTYVFVLTTDGTEIVNPAFPNLEGRNLIDHKDAAGKFLVKEMIDKTQGGQSAWVEYYWARPGTAEQVRKLAYVRRVQVAGKEVIIGAGLYE